MTRLYNLKITDEESEELVTSVSFRLNTDDTLIISKFNFDEEIQKIKDIYDASKNEFEERIQKLMTDVVELTISPAELTTVISNSQNEELRQSIMDIVKDSTYLSTLQEALDQEGIEINATTFNNKEYSELSEDYTSNSKTRFLLNEFNFTYDIDSESETYGNIILEVPDCTDVASNEVINNCEESEGE